MDTVDRLLGGSYLQQVAGWETAQIAEEILRLHQSEARLQGQVAQAVDAVAVQQRIADKLKEKLEGVQRQQRLASEVYRNMFREDTADGVAG